MRLDFVTDNGPAKRLGLVVLQTDETIESEFRRMIPPQVALYCSRVPSSDEVTEQTLAAMADHLPAAARLLPAAGGLDAIAYACTSGATMIGSDRVASLLRGAAPHLSETPATNPLAAVKAACRTLGARHIGFVTPYIASVSAAMQRALEEDGLTISAFGSFEQIEERVVARIEPASVLEAIVNIGEAKETDAVFASCTNLRTIEIIAEAERRLGKPVISSNQALAWHLLRLAGVKYGPTDCGALFDA